MIREENDCVGCPDGVPCYGDSCKMRHVLHIYCDICGEEIYPHEVSCDFHSLFSLKHHYHDDCLEEEKK